MAKPISISLVSDVKDFLRGTKDAEKGLDDVADSLDDLARDANKAGDKAGDSLADGIKDGTKDADTALEKLETSFKQMSDSAKRESKEAGNAVERNLKEGTHGASEGMDNLKEEAGQTARESAASFDGSADSIVDAFQEVAANAFIGFGPAGMAAGLAIAAGMGFAISAGQDAATAINDAKTRVGELALAIFDAGGDISNVDIGGMMRDWGVQIADNKEWWEIWQDSAVSNLGKAEKAAKDFGLEADDMFKAMSGYDQDAARRVLQDLQGQLEDLEDQAKKNREVNPFAGFSDNAAIDFQVTAIKNQITELENLSGVSAQATEDAEKLAAMTEQETAAAEAAEAAEQARADAIGALQSGIDDAIGSYDEFKDKETGALDPAGYIAAMQARVDATGNFNSNVQNIATQFGLSQEEVQAILDQGVDFAPMLQSIIDSGLQGQFVDQIKQGVGGGQDILDGTPLNATVEADIEPSQKSIRQLMDEKRETKPVDVKAETKAAEKEIKAVADRPWKTSITAEAQTYAASRALDALASKTRTANITAIVRDQYGRKLN